MSEEGITGINADETVARNNSFSGSEKSLIRKNDSCQPQEEQKVYLDTDTTSQSDIIEQTKEESAENDQNQQITKPEEAEVKPAPSVEVSQSPKNQADPYTEKSLPIIEEEKSASSSVSELIEAEEDNLEEKAIKTDFKSIPEENKSCDNTNLSSEDANTVAETTTTACTEPVSDQLQYNSLSKQNEVLRSRISELVDQLQKAKKEIERLRDLLAEYSDESNNPTILKARLASQTKENEDLKRRILRESAQVSAAAAKEKKLSNELANLRGANQQLSGKLAQKEREINDLDDKIADLTTTLRTLTRHGSLENGRLALKEPTICHTPARCSRRNQMSKICVIL